MIIIIIACFVELQAENDKMPECLWLTPILQDSLRHIYQRFILESDGDVVEMVYKVIKKQLVKIQRCFCFQRSMTRLHAL